MAKGINISSNWTILFNTWKKKMKVKKEKKVNEKQSFSFGGDVDDNDSDVGDDGKQNTGS